MANYITASDIRATGFDQDVPQTYTDQQITDAITLWQQALERMCRQWFESRALVIQCDGNDSDTLNFGVPIITIDYIKLNGASSELPTDQYEIYNSRTYPDDRRNPRIKLASDGDSDIYTGSWNNAKFRKGRKNQEISGTFGFLESDDSCPLLIKRALIKLVIEKLSNPLWGTYSGGSSSSSVGAILEEWTDGHRLKYGGATKPGGSGFHGITTDREILDIVKMYRAPLGIATPANWSK